MSGSKLHISLESDHDLPTTDELASLAEIRTALRNIHGVSTRAGLSSRLARPGSVQNAIEWRELVVTSAATIPPSVLATLLADILIDWLKGPRGREERGLTLRVGDAEVKIERPSAEDRERALRILENWVDNETPDDRDEDEWKFRPLSQ